MVTTIEKKVSVGTAAIMKRAGKYVDRHYTKNIRLSDVAKKFGMSQYHFSRSFHRYFSMTFKRMILTRKVEKAKEYLRKGVTQKDVVVYLKFSTQSHFCATFRKITGVPPGQMMRN